MKVVKVESTKTTTERRVRVTLDTGQKDDQGQPLLEVKEYAFGLVQKKDKTWALPPVSNVASEVKAYLQDEAAKQQPTTDSALADALADLIGVKD